ncbi:nucleotidyltransferase family protein [Burkholderia sp. WAC0059]|uniref:nucleotidyltransferase family protein n=1 Tax=Burkholderia sp. WAC0059 TaxID=2066022 RepID=UPI000C7F288C|nr:nucleotidyltransferase family protein [Burkholderia sp. WAC0059]PLZ04052.1 nucleotidyltransferase family protein [Burkholderia sp. WAC0059]
MNACASSPSPAATAFSAVVLAAGLSSRMAGRHKLLLPLRGEPAVRRTVRAVLDAGPREVVVVTGFNGRAIFEALDGLPVTFRGNPRYAQGQMTSVAAGVAALQSPCDVVMICLADQVLLEAADYRELVEAWAARPRGSILVPMSGGERGNPVLFAASYTPEVVNGHVNPGCRKLIAEHGDEVFVHEAAHDRFTTDMDTPEDYARIVARLGGEAGVGETGAASGGADPTGRMPVVSATEHG